MSFIPQIALYTLGAGLQGVQAFQAAKQQKKAQQAAQKAINQLKQIKEVNPFAALQVPTMGAQLQQDALARATAAGAQSLQSAGAEGVIGGVGNLVGGVGAEAAKIGAGLQQAEYQRDLAQAGQEAAIGQRAAEREFKIGAQEAAGYQAMRAEAEARKNAALMGIGGSLAGLSGQYTEYLKTNPYGSVQGLGG